jgi:hypothetical protein
LCILCVNLCLVAGMVVGLQWALGAVEAVSITVFVGKHARCGTNSPTKGQMLEVAVHRACLPSYLPPFWVRHSQLGLRTTLVSATCWHVSALEA